MPRAVVLQYFHACPGDEVSAGQRERIGVAVRARRRPSDHGAKFVKFDDAHTGFCVADRAPVGDEGLFRSKERLGGRQEPLAAALKLHVGPVGQQHDREMPLGALQERIA